MSDDLIASFIAIVEVAVKYPREKAEEIVKAIMKAMTAQNKLDFNI